MIERSNSTETLLDEVEVTIADILAQVEVAPLDTGLTTWALDCCRELRDALAKGDAAAAAYVGCRLGERLAEIRRLGDIARQAASYVAPVERAHDRDVERRRVYFAEVKRGFSQADASKRAGEKLSVSAKTIMRAVNGH
jgi:hypothetical protein